MGRKLRDWKIQMLIWMDFRYSSSSQNKIKKPSWSEKWYDRGKVWESHDFMDKIVIKKIWMESCHSNHSVQFRPNWHFLPETAKHIIHWEEEEKLLMEKRLLKTKPMLL